MEAIVMTTPDAPFEDLLHECHPRLCRLARQYAHAGDFEDLLQDMRMQLWLSLDGFDGRSRLSTWIYRVALNTAISHQRKRRIPVRNPDDRPERGDTGSVHNEMDILEDFLQSLDPANRALLVMDLEGMDRAEIADVLGLSPGAVAVRMTRLRRRFEKRYVTAEDEHVLE